MSDTRERVPAPVLFSDIGLPYPSSGWAMKVDGRWINYAEHLMRRGMDFPEEPGPYRAVMTAMDSRRLRRLP